MDLTRRGFLAALGALGTAAVATGCAAGGSSAGNADGAVEGEITLLTPMFEGSSGKQLLEGTLLPSFLKRHPKARVRVDYTTYAALNEKITTALAGGLLPDVLMLGVGWVPPFAHKKVLAPLPDSVAARHQYEPRVLEPSRYDGKLYALPVVLDTRVVAYRKDMFDKAGIKGTPQDWTELRALAKELTRRDAAGKLATAGFDPFSVDLRQCWETLLFANGGKLFDEAGRTPLFDDERGVAALQLFLDLIADRSTEYSFKSETGQPSLIQQGKAAMAMTTTALWLQMEQQTPELIKDDAIGTFVVRNTNEAMLQGGTLASVSAHSRQPAVARALVEFLASPEVILPASRQRGSVPAVRSLRDSEYVKNNKFVGFALDNLDKAYSEGGTAAWMEIREKIKPTLETAVVGQRGAAEALKELSGLAANAIGRL
ncbi:ABC transporter substrate-binding protein [Nonomuraea sp. NPDC050540]|uniref:ABC transporter substrate-binding protein n=1 Tax=Nonomuraea sp. NPDC050540 TaxID=3364367 RepID=UPI003788A442